jgi:mannosyl-3-phosphoglycerate phosphatase
MKQDLIVFTDLDGSLLDHEDYSYREAGPALARIRQGLIPLVFVTSKTRNEVESLQREMGTKEPFIVENGGGIFFPAGYRGLTIAEGRFRAGYKVIELGVSYGRIRGFLARFGGRFGIRGFGDWSTSEIAARTGLSLDRAALAAQREFTEPFVMAAGADMAALKVLAAEHGLKITRGGRFYHLIGAGQDKGAAVKAAREIFARYLGGKPVAIGIGDSENDLPMLAQVDIPVLIPRPDNTRLDPRLPRLVIAGHPGSRGWNEAMENILDGFATEADRNL